MVSIFNDCMFLNYKQISFHPSEKTVNFTSKIDKYALKPNFIDRMVKIFA